MSYLVDSNVLSVAIGPAPDPEVLEWLRRHERQLVVDPIVLGEIRFGIHLLSPGKRRRRLERWFEEGQPDRRHRPRSWPDCGYAERARLPEGGRQGR